MTAIALAVAALCLVAFQVPAVPFSDPAIRAVSGGEGLFDVRPYYTPADVRRALAAFGEEGRQRYLWFLGADAVFLVAYAIGLSGWLARRLGRGRAAPLAWLPFVLAGLDAVEDLLLAAILRLPPHPTALYRAAGAVTALKHTATASVAAAVAFALFRQRPREPGGRP